MDSDVHHEVTCDSLFSGRLTCRQPARGYRFSIDSVLLAHFIRPRSGDAVLDLGAGCGVISLILAYRYSNISLIALEIQSRLSQLIRHNVSSNAFENRIQVIEGDMQQINSLVEPGRFDWVVCNPPYRKVASGRVNSTKEQAVARHEIRADLSQVVAAISYSLRTRGRLAVVYPARRAASLITALKANGLEPKRLQMVHSYPGGEGRLVLVEALKGGGEELNIQAPLYIYEEVDGDYTREMLEMFGNDEQ
ncbi:tRNA1(Val) (adenine(37)-N6)-methyltransferase [Thermodesulfobacteriota bacterium]